MSSINTFHLTRNIEPDGNVNFHTQDPLKVIFVNVGKFVIKLTIILYTKSKSCDDAISKANTDFEDRILPIVIRGIESNNGLRTNPSIR